MIAVFTCVYLWLVLHLCCSPVFLCLWHFCISDPCLLTANCSLILLIPITVYTIYFHPQHTVPTASEKDNLVISYLTLNIISIKTVSSIDVSLTLGDYCFLYTIYTERFYVQFQAIVHSRLSCSSSYTRGNWTKVGDSVDHSQWNVSRSTEGQFTRQERTTLALIRTGYCVLLKAYRKRSSKGV